MIYDLAIIGGGINGAALLREATRRGASAILLERADFGGGSTSRSSRLLHCGLRYLAPGSSMARFLSSPGQLARALRTVRRSMEARNRLVAERPHLLSPIRMTFPIFEGDTYRGWQIDAAFALLGWFGRGGAPLDYRRYAPGKLGEPLPFAACLPDDRPLRSVIAYTEYQIDWPERLTLDLILEAESSGARARNYCPVTAIEDRDGKWHLETPDGAVAARAVANLAGPWVDCVAGLERPDRPRMVNTTRGAHLSLHLPDAFRGHGIMTMSGLDHPFYCFPSRDRHFIGPTESPSTEDPDRVRPEANEWAELKAELARQLPGLAVAPDTLIGGWAGLRPLTHEPATMMAARNRVIHDLSRAGGAKMLALTNGSIGAHAITARDMAAQFGLAGSAAQIDLPILDHSAASAAEHARQHGRHLDDVMGRRMGLIWDADAGLDRLDAVAGEVGAALGWDAETAESEKSRYRALVHDLGLLGDAG